MVVDKTCETAEDANPYIALADLAINLVLILAFFVAAVIALGRAGWEQVRYRDAQNAFRQAVKGNLPQQLRPHEHFGKNDPPGVQRWVFAGGSLFVPGTTRLRSAGENALVRFAQVLRTHQADWRRIRIEGHTMPPRNGTPDDWELSSARAAVVARVIQERGHIPSYFLAVAGRAGQDPLTKVIVYTQPDSVGCDRAKCFLAARRISYSEKDITHDAGAAQELREMGCSTTPVTVADGQLVQGFTADRIARITANYPGNERVEILVEYAQPTKSLTVDHL
jgi:chemotaxis protein MotB